MSPFFRASVTDSVSAVSAASICLSVSVTPLRFWAFSTMALSSSFLYMYTFLSSACGSWPPAFFYSAG